MRFANETLAIKASFLLGKNWIFEAKTVELQSGYLVFRDAGRFSDLIELLEAVKKIPYPNLVLKESTYLLNLSKVG